MNSKPIVDRAVELLRKKGANVRALRKERARLERLPIAEVYAEVRELEQGSGAAKTPRQMAL